jgi:hypothetical protein
VDTGAAVVGLCRWLPHRLRPAGQTKVNSRSILTPPLPGWLGL